MLSNYASRALLFHTCVWYVIFMSTLSKEFITETKKEIQRLEALVKSFESRIESLQELLEDNSSQAAAPKTSNKKKTTKSRENKSDELEESGISGEA